MAIPPVTLNLLQHLSGDDQQTFTDKLNFNFDQIVSLGGGPPGEIGITGNQGVPGGQGIQGFVGTTGTPGSKWYVQTTTPTGSPAPNEGDFWFNSGTLNVYEFQSGVWVLTGTLIISGLFKEAVSDTDKVIWTSPTPLKSLVLSPLNYGVGAPQAGPYKLKLIGSSGTSLLNFGVVETGSVENSSSKQSYISSAIVTPGTEYSLSIVNPAGNLLLSTPGTSLKLIPQVSNLSVYEFNGNTFKVQTDNDDILMSFATGPFATPGVGSTINYIIGLHDAISNTSSRIVQVMNDQRISLRDAESNPVSGDFQLFRPTYIDVNHPQLAASPPFFSTLPSYESIRMRGKISAANDHWVKLLTRRTFTDIGNTTDPWRSVATGLVGGVDATAWHNITFDGGAASTSFTERPQLRMGTDAQQYQFVMDALGYIGIGDTAFITGNNNSALAYGVFPTRLNIQAAGTTYAGPVASTLTGHGGVHFYMDNTNQIGGFTAGGFGTKKTNTYGGIWFKDANAVGTDVIIGTGQYAGPGVKQRLTIANTGISYFWQDTNPQSWMDIEPFNDYTAINAYDTVGNGGSGMSRNIVFQKTYDSITDGANGFVGGGFVGIGDMFQANANGQPQTKFHLVGAGTFGTRLAIISYGTDAGGSSAASHNNWTFGTNHYANASNALILGGNAHILTGANSVIIGGNGNGITMPDANKILAATVMHVSTAAPSVLNTRSLFTAGDPASFSSVQTQFALTGAPILNISSLIPTSGFLVGGQIGYYGPIATLEARTNTAALTGVMAGLEYHIVNNVGQKRLTAAISANYFEPTSGTPRGLLSFALNYGTSGSGDLYEMLRMSALGLQFIPSDPTIKQKISVIDSNVTGGSGNSLFISAGGGNSIGVTTGGNLSLDGGRGQGGGANGGIVIGGIVGGQIDIGVIGGIFGSTTRVNIKSPVTAHTNIVRADEDYTTGTDTPGFTVLPMNTLSAPSLGLDSQGAVSYNQNISFLTYKRLGKTMILHFKLKGIDYVNSTGSIWYIRLPAALQPVTPHVTVSATLQERFEQGVAFFRHNVNVEADKIAQVYLQKDNSGSPLFGTGTWYLVLIPGYRQNVASGPPFAAANTLSMYYADNGQNNSEWSGTITYGVD